MSARSGPTRSTRIATTLALLAMLSSTWLATAPAVAAAAPVANDDAVTVIHDRGLIIHHLGNDSDPDGNLRILGSLQSVTDPLHGVASGICWNGCLLDGIAYSPDPGFVGIDTFSYTIADTNGETDSATVTVTVTNQPPTAVTDNAATALGVGVQIIVHFNDTDPDGDGLARTAVADPPNGTASLSCFNVCSIPTILYVPDVGFEGIDTFTYTVTDGVASVEGTINVRVGDPDVDGDGLRHTQEIANGTDPEDADTDDDGLEDGFEITTSGTDPLDADSDDDGVLDGPQYHGAGIEVTDCEAAALWTIASVAGDLVLSDPDCVRFSLPSVASVGGDMVLTGSPTLTTIDAPALVDVGGDMDISGNATLTTIETPELVEVGGDMTFAADPTLTTIDAPAIETVGGDIEITNNATLTTIEAPMVETVGGDMIFTGNPTLTTIDVGDGAVVAGNVDVDISAPTVTLIATVTGSTRVTAAGASSVALRAGAGSTTVALNGQDSSFRLLLPEGAAVTGSDIVVETRDPASSPVEGVDAAGQAALLDELARVDVRADLAAGGPFAEVAFEVAPEDVAAMVGTGPVIASGPDDGTGVLTALAACEAGQTPESHRCASATTSLAGMVLVKATTDHFSSWAVVGVSPVATPNRAPTVEVTPHTLSVDVGDPVAVAVVATDPDGDPVVLSVTGLPDGALLTDNGDATGEVGGSIIAAPGSYSATVMASDGDLAGTATAAISVTPEDATAAYSGNLFFLTPSSDATAATLTLRAHVTQADDGSAGDLRGARVVFDLYRATNMTMASPDLSVPAAVAADGSAAASLANVAADNWTVIVRFDPASFFAGPDSDPVVVTVHQPGSDRSASGGGWVTDPSTGDRPVAVDSAHAKGHLGFSVRYRKGTTSPQGQFVYSFRGVNGYDYVIKSTSWQGGGLAFPSRTSASFSGKASVVVLDPATGLPVTALGTGNLTYRIDVTDGASGQLDRFAMRVQTSTGATYHVVGTTARQVALGGGNIEVHR